MSLLNTVEHSNGEILTGKLWRTCHAFFNDLPFYSNIPRMEEIASPLQKALGEDDLEGCYRELLVVSRRAVSYLIISDAFTRNLERV